jgi:hypothetical protein
MMHKYSVTRRGFAHPPMELMLGLIVLGLTIGLALPFIKIAQSYGYSWWSALFIVPVSLIGVVAYVFGIPLLIFKISKKYFHTENNNDVGVWFGAVLWITWLSAFVFMIAIFVLTSNK